MSTAAQQSISESIEKIQAAFDRAVAADAAEFAADIAYLNSYADAQFEFTPHQLPALAEPSILEQLLLDTAPSDLAAIIGVMSPLARAELLWPVI
ncbi:hypothetical protein [Mycobacterium malmoense]|uniref:hypothetical protein n=1 Tax=Mycobacterium malmoense TaxID=1780 RepID=UPI0008F8281A|nr:hypothetical protein [Mycobacterium malmoense]OIN79991.1 hypothetical protein BMG05_15040 [Mycobacterium malmoense]